MCFSPVAKDKNRPRYSLSYLLSRGISRSTLFSSLALMTHLILHTCLLHIQRQSNKEMFASTPGPRVCPFQVPHVCTFDHTVDCGLVLDKACAHRGLCSPAGTVSCPVLRNFICLCKPSANPPCRPND